MDKKKIDRINELAKKAKTEGLTPDEETERQELRKEYIEAYKKNLRSQLDNTVVIRPDGTHEKLGKKEKK